MYRSRLQVRKPSSTWSIIVAPSDFNMANRKAVMALPELRGYATMAEQMRNAPNKWKGTSTTGGETKLYINGEWISSKTRDWIEVHDPSTQTVLTKVPKSTPAELNAAVQAASSAFESWSNSSILSRQNIMLKYQALIREHTDALATSIVLEQGKTFSDARGDVFRGLQVVDSVCSLPSLLLGDTIAVAKDMDTYTRRLPLGVGAAICPFNFPAMVPLWTIPIAIAAGNTLILKPSERDPGAAAILVELAERAGVPAGVLNLVHGAVDTVNFLCDAPEIRAISFVGGDTAGAHIAERAGRNGKRVQANLGAKNHAVLMPDANKNASLNSLIGAAFGAAGQRCMALSVLIAVGKSKDWIPEIVERARVLKVTNGFEPHADLGPVISPASLNKIESLIASCEEQGGKILLDGRQHKVDGYPHGNWVGPTVLEAKEGFKCHETEIFGPVLTILQCENLDEAIQLINRNKYGNGAAIFTQSGSTARKFEMKTQVGQVGINSPIPVPLPMFSWSGNKGSVIGQTGFYGKLGLNFWTQNKTVTTLWRAEDAGEEKADMAMPTQR
ncbi:hypothetical protein B7494_g4223 [Chlorociboria aeruginascens]|nr:hypothetical protein B7494_g4223 [Chlorociboria aeruginascens]